MILYQNYRKNNKGEFEEIKNNKITVDIDNMKKISLNLA